MIGRRGRFLVFIYIILLVVLFLMCSTDLIIREPEKEIYQIAVIIEDVRSDNYSNFRKGMDQAAIDYNMDVRFITLYEKFNVEQQIELIHREQQDDVDALIVVPADEQQITNMQTMVPVIFLCSQMAKGAGAGSIIIDYEGMGEYLAHRMLENIPREGSVLILTDSTRQNDIDRLFVESAIAVFEADEYNTRKIARNGENGFGEILKALETKEGEKTVILAENQEILTEVARILADDPTVAECVSGVYGRGNTISNLNYLDRGQITGICVTDDYSIGYLSVRAASQALEGADNLPIEMEFYYIEKEDLREPAFEKLLFPIE